MKTCLVWWILARQGEAEVDRTESFVRRRFALPPALLSMIGKRTWDGKRRTSRGMRYMMAFLDRHFDLGCGMFGGYMVTA